MKRKLQFILGASAVSLLAGTALAQNSPTLNLDRQIYNEEDGPTNSHPAIRLNGAARASAVIGMAVENYQGEKLGKVEDVAVDVESGRVIQIILSTGGFLGVGDTLTAVPPGALHHDVSKKVLHLDANKEKLSGAPRFETARWSECCDSNHLSAVYGYYGQESAFRFIHKGDAVRDGLRNPDGSIIRAGQRNPESTPAAAVTTGVTGLGTTNRSMNDRHSMIPVSRLGQIQKASKVLGLTVNNLQGEKLGKVEDLLLDLPAGRIVVLVVSSGGFLGLGDELSAVPPTALRFSTDRDTLQLDATKEVFTAAPHFKSNQWPDFGQPVPSGGVYSAYQMQPYFAPEAGTAADNSRRNVRDRYDRSLTPLDQGNSEGDINTTAQIRKEIVADKTMSVNAQNVKIITKQGQVTLRGPVNSTEEKRLVGEVAIRIARVENVDNQLEVKRTVIE